MAHRKIYILLLLVPIVGAFGLCVGEEIIPFPLGMVIAAPLFFLLFPIGFFLGYPSRLEKWTACLGLPFLLALSFAVGAADQGNAYGDCLQRGEELRKALSQYQKAHGRYPSSLNQLGWENLPGKRWIGGSILHYEATGKGYRMYFSGGPDSVAATESQPFEQLFI